MIYGIAGKQTIAYGMTDIFMNCCEKFNKPVLICFSPQGLNGNALETHEQITTGGTV